MNAGKTLKSVIATCPILALPISAIAGRGHVRPKKQKQVNLDQPATRNSAVEKNTRNWAQFDFNGDRQISATEIQGYLDGQIALNEFNSAQLPVGLAGLEIPAPKTLSSTDLGMHYAHGPGKDNSSAKVVVPGVTYTEVMPTEVSNNPNVNKRAMLLEVKEAMLETDGKAK